MSLYQDCILVCQDLRKEVDEEEKLKINAIQRGLIPLIIDQKKETKILEKDMRGAILTLIKNFVSENAANLEVSQCEKEVSKILKGEKKRK